MYIHMDICNICICRMYVFICVDTYINTYTDVCIETLMYVCLYTYLHVYISIAYTYPYTLQLHYGNVILFY